METEVKRLHDEVVTLTAAIEAAIEEAIKNGQKSVVSRNETPVSRQGSNKDLADTRIEIGSKVVGWVEDF